MPAILGTLTSQRELAGAVQPGHLKPIRFPELRVSSKVRPPQEVPQLLVVSGLVVHLQPPLLTQPSGSVDVPEPEFSEEAVLPDATTHPFHDNGIITTSNNEKNDIPVTPFAPHSFWKSILPQYLIVAPETSTSSYPVIPHEYHDHAAQSSVPQFTDLRRSENHQQHNLNYNEAIFLVPNAEDNFSILEQIGLPIKPPDQVITMPEYGSFGFGVTTTNSNNNKSNNQDHIIAKETNDSNNNQKPQINNNKYMMPIVEQSPTYGESYV